MIARRAFSAFSAFGLVLSLVMACGDDAADPAPAPAPDATALDASDSATTTPGDAAEDAADATTVINPEVDAFCKASLGLFEPSYTKCCNASDAPKRHNLDVQLLRGVYLACTQYIGKSVNNGRVTFSQTAADTCAANVKTYIDGRACIDAVYGPTNEPAKDIFRGAAGCSTVVAGKQAADAPCANDYECADGLTCIGWTPQSDGTCKTPPGLAAACSYGLPDGGSGFLDILKWGFGNHPRCGAGFYCPSVALQQPTCRASVQADGDCDVDDQCAAGLVCRVGKCGTGPRNAVDGACERNSDCQDRLFCKSKVCSVRQLAGTACTNDVGSECQGACVRPDGGTPSCVSYCGSQ